MKKILIYSSKICPYCIAAKRLFKQYNLKFEEKNIEPYDVYTADEAFMTGTPFCMLPVTSLNNLSIGTGKVGNIFNKILDQWSKNVGINISQQIKNWDKKRNTKASLSNPTPYKFK